MEKTTFFGNTDMGQIRTNNEDAFIAQYIWDKKHILAVAIDGVGGYEGGEVASAIAQKSIVEYLESYSNGERLDLLKQAVIHANNTILAERDRQPEYKNMSCVLTASLIELESRRINMAHVGDTRLYQYANGEIMKLSHDHSLIGYREEIGELTEEEAMKHPQRNVIGKDVGSKHLDDSGSNYIEVASFYFAQNSSLLLCSDGLCDMVTSAQMKMELEKDIPVEEKVNNLIAAANRAGGKDNVTVIVVESKNPDFAVASNAPNVVTEYVSSNPESCDCMQNVEVEYIAPMEYETEANIEVEYRAEYDQPKSNGVRVPLWATFCIAFTTLIIGCLIGIFVANTIFPTGKLNHREYDSISPIYITLKPDSAADNSAVGKKEKVEELHQSSSTSLDESDDIGEPFVTDTVNQLSSEESELKSVSELGM